ncbi:hypothetical protein BBP40_001183 [Aspergillus hancockii]|nr:hypothetical protein BBP40_001183 [Aspergillus hancockii]
MELAIASGICFSALFKLANHHSCDMLSEDSDYLEAGVAPRVRACMQRCLDMLKDICGRVLSLVRDLRGNLTRPALARVSPLMLHCVYNCATNLSWMSLETNNPQYATGKLICEDILSSINIRWKVAGVYLELLRASDLAQSESR